MTDEQRCAEIERLSVEYVALGGKNPDLGRKLAVMRHQLLISAPAEEREQLSALIRDIDLAWREQDTIAAKIGTEE